MKYILIAILLVSCYSENKARKGMDKAKLNYPTIVANKCSQWFPIDTTVTKSDSVGYKMYLVKLDSLNKSILIQYDTIHDSMILYNNTKEIVYKYNTFIKQLPAIHDTIKVIDRAKQEAIEGKLKETESNLLSNYKMMNKVFIFGLLLLLILFIISILKK